MRFIQVSLYIAEHRQELEEEGGKDKAQVKLLESGLLTLTFWLVETLWNANFSGNWLGQVEEPQCNWEGRIQGKHSPLGFSLNSLSQVARFPRRPEESKRKRSEEDGEQVGGKEKTELLSKKCSCDFPFFRNWRSPSQVWNRNWLGLASETNY